jgi:hypothetical protein
VIAQQRKEKRLPFQKLPLLATRPCRDLGAAHLRGCYGTEVQMMLEGRWDGSSSLFSGLGVLTSGDLISGGAECLSEARCAEHFDDSLEVVSHDGDADFSLSTCQAPQ